MPSISSVAIPAVALTRPAGGGAGFATLNIGRQLVKMGVEVDIEYPIQARVQHRQDRQNRIIEETEPIGHGGPAMTEWTVSITDRNPHLTYTTATVAQTERDKSIGDPRGNGDSGICGLPTERLGTGTTGGGAWGEL